MVSCPRCKCQILPEHEKLSCHAHNDSNKWRTLATPGLELFEILRTKNVVKEVKDG